MCGIFACRPVVGNWLRDALEKQRDRGPDQEAIHVCGDIGLAVNRLAITGDLEAGSQPVFSLSGNSLCVFNGAIYNTDAIRNRFGLDPRSTNDAAVALELYETIGLDFINSIQGMFAIVIVDRRLERMIVARDPLGIKPLYWAEHDGQRVFASSLKAIPNALLPYVAPFPPGTIWSDGGNHVPISPRVTAEDTLEDTLVQAVRSHIPTEVGWGCGLSGGVDSSLICAIARSLRHDFGCYSLSTGTGGDFPAAKHVAEWLGVRIRPVEVTKDDVVRAIPIVVEATGTYESEIVLGGLGTYLVAKAAASDGLKVLLTGEGADEIFGGYDRYKSLPPYMLNDTLVEDQVTFGQAQCKRLDHAAMAASIETRVPFMDVTVVARARVIPPSRKVDVRHPMGDKICLREVAEKYLPASIARRTKAVMSTGSGMLELLRQAVQGMTFGAVTEAEYHKFRWRNRAELVFYSIWRETFGDMGTGRADLQARLLIYYPRRWSRQR